MDIISIILGSLGVGGILGYCIKYLLDQRTEIQNKIRLLNEDKYRSTLVFMRCLLEPDSIKQFGFSNKDEINLKSMSDDTEIKNYCKSKVVEYYYHSFLYASNNVISEIKNFIENPSEDNFIKVANTMRKDLWGRKKVNVTKKQKITCK